MLLSNSLTEEPTVERSGMQFMAVQLRARNEPSALKPPPEKSSAKRTSGKRGRKPIGATERIVVKLKPEQKRMFLKQGGRLWLRKNMDQLLYQESIEPAQA